MRVMIFLLLNIVFLYKNIKNKPESGC